MVKISHSESFWTTLFGKDWKKSEMIKIEHSTLFWTTLVGRDGKRCRMTKIGCSNDFHHFGRKRLGKV